jgi:hypothetical protein
VDLARAGTGTRRVPPREQPVHRRAAPRNRHRRRSRLSGRRAAGRNGYVRRRRRDERPERRDRDHGRVLRHARPPRLDRRPPERPGRRGGRRRDDRPDGCRRPPRALCLPRRAHQRRSERLPRSAGLPASTGRHDPARAPTGTCACGRATARAARLEAIAAGRHHARARSRAGSSDNGARRARARPHRGARRDAGSGTGRGADRYRPRAGDGRPIRGNACRTPADASSADESAVTPGNDRGAPGLAACAASRGDRPVRADDPCTGAARPDSLPPPAAAHRDCGSSRGDASAGCASLAPSGASTPTDRRDQVGGGPVGDKSLRRPTAEAGASRSVDARLGGAGRCRCRHGAGRSRPPAPAAGPRRQGQT